MSAPSTPSVPSVPSAVGGQHSSSPSGEAEGGLSSSASASAAQNTKPESTLLEGVVALPSSAPQNVTVVFPNTAQKTGAPSIPHTTAPSSPAPTSASTHPSEPEWITQAVVYAMHKPRGMLTTNVATARGDTITHRRPCMGAWLQEIIAKEGKRVFHIGRLDKKTSGLLLATSMGHFERFICTPGMLPKEYIVTTERLVTPEMVQSLVDGLELSDGPAKALEAELLQCTTERRTVAAAQMQRTGKMSRAERKRKAIEMEASATDGAGSVVVEKTTSVVRMVINMGRNHIVKRMFDHIGLSVTKLHRSAVGPSSLASLNLPEDGTEVKLSADTLRALWNARTVGTEVIASDEEVDDEN